MIVISASSSSDEPGLRGISVGWYFLILMLALCISPRAHAGTPLDSVQTQVNALLSVLRDPSFKTLPTNMEKREKIWPIINEIFDYKELSMRTLARNWEELTAQQRQEFTDLFSKLLAIVYMDRLLEYTNEKVIFGKERILSNDKVEVQSKIVTSSKEIPIHYRLILKNNTWKVYDLLIEGVSLIRNYRSQFQTILRKQSPEELLSMLRKKVGK